MHTTTTGLDLSSSSRFTLSITLLGRSKVPFGGRKRRKVGCVVLILGAFVPVLMWFLLEGLGSVSAIMESVAVVLADELKDQGTFSNSFVALLYPSSISPTPGWEYHSTSSPILFVSFSIDSSTLRENDNNYASVSNSFISTLLSRFSFLLIHVFSPSQA
jgi:hypothetical protein